MGLIDKFLNWITPKPQPVLPRLPMPVLNQGGILGALTPRTLRHGILHSDNDYVIFTDGCYERKKCSWAAIFISPDGETEVARISGYSATTSSRNIEGEVDAVLHALQHALSLGAKKVEIHHDYNMLEDVAVGKCKAKAPIMLRYVATVRPLMAQFERVTFVHVPGHSGNLWNNAVNRLAARPSKTAMVHVLTTPSTGLTSVDF